MAAGLYIHVLPGRLRVDLPGLKADPALIERVQELEDEQGISRVRCSTVTGRALIEFDALALSVESILSWLGKLGAFTQTLVHKPLTRMAVNTIFDAASDVLVESSFKLALTLVA